MANKNKIISQAQKFISKGQWDKAIKELQKLVAEDPNDVRTLLKLGDVYSKKGDRENATRVYKQVAESYSEQGFFLKAVAVYKQILKHDSQHLQVTLKLAELYEHLGLTSEAMAQYHRASQIQEERGDGRQTLDILKRMVDLDSENVASRIKLAESYSKENKVAEATQEFEKAAQILKNQNRVDDYIKVAERLVYHDQNRFDVVKELARLYLDRGDAKRGLAKLQVCFKAQPRDVETLQMLAQAFITLGQQQKTIFVYKELAGVYMDEGNDQEAQRVVQQILQLDPNDPDARGILSGGQPAAPPRMPSIPPPPPPPAPAPSLAPRPSSVPGQDWNVPSQPGYPFGSAKPEPPLAPSLQPRPATQPRMPSLAPRPPPPPPDDALILDDPVEAPPTLAPRAVSQTRSEEGQIAKVLTETDVYIKYGLREKALSHVRKIFEIDPDNVEAYEKMRDIYRAMGDHARAAEALANLMHVHHKRGDQGAVAATRQELAALAPGHPLATGGIPGAIPAPLSQDEASDQISIDIDDIDEASGVFELTDEIQEPIEDEPIGDEPLGDLADEPLMEDGFSYAIESHDLLSDEVDPGLINDAVTDRGPITDLAFGAAGMVEEELPEASSGVVMLSDVETDAADGLDAPPSFADEEDPEEELVDPFAGNESSEITARSNIEDVREEEQQTPDAVPPEVTQRSDIQLGNEEPEGMVDDNLLGEIVAEAEAALTGGGEDEGEADDELDEAEFLVEAGLEEEAKQAIQAVLDRFPTNARALELLDRLAASIAADDEPTDRSDGDALPLDHLPLPEDDGTSPTDRYDQGMMFKEIGRLDDAIREFRGAAESETRRLESLEMIGHCLVENSQPEHASAYFERALQEGAEGISRINLKYEIGNAAEAAGNKDVAVAWFTACYQDDPDHRDVSDRLERLGGPKSNGPSGGNGALPKPQVLKSSKKSKISYL